MGFLKHDKRSISRSYDYYDSICYSSGLQNATLSTANFPAMMLSSVYAAVNIISNSLAMLPITVITKEKNKKTILDDCFVYHMFDDTLMTKFDTIKQMVADLLLHGNAFAYIDRSGDKISLRYLDRSYVTVNFDPITERLSYKLEKFNTKKEISRDDIIHLRMNASDGVNGRGILHFAQQSIGLSKSTEKAANSYISSGGKLHGVLSTDQPLITPENRKEILDSWRQSEVTGTAVLPMGFKYSSTTDNSKDAQMLESRIFNIQEICRYFNLPPVKIGELSHTQYGSVEEGNIEYVQSCILPLADRIENEFNRKLMKDSNYSINLDINVLLKSDKQSEANYITTLVKNGIITPNEGRNILGYNALEGADRIMVNYTDIESNTIAEQDE